MASVTQRIKSIQQPHGGYLPIKAFSKEKYDDGVVLNEDENIHPSIIGIVVDYLTRFMTGSSVEQAFHISILGAQTVGMQSVALKLKADILGLDNKSIISACKLAGFDGCYRSSAAAYKPIEEIDPSIATIENIRTMVNRSLAFWKKYGPIVSSEPTFEGGYSSVVNSGDADYVTNDTLWDFKVYKTALTSKHTLQILMYYVLGLHSIHDYYKKITHLGFFNPRTNTVYKCPVSAISEEVIEEIENTVICYNAPTNKVSKTQKPVSEHKHTSVHNEIYYSVADICQETRQKKNDVYVDIRLGKLSASKKGNKYIVSECEYNRYIEYVKTRQRIKLIASVVLGITVLIFILIMFKYLKNDYLTFSY